jgi:hypothetical protein
MEKHMKKNVAITLAGLALLLSASCTAAGSSSASGPGGDLLPIEVNGKWGFIDRTGTTVVPAQFVTDSESFPNFEFIDGVALVQYDNVETGKFGFIKPNGEPLFAETFDGLRECSEGLVAFRVGPYEGGKWGFVDKAGKVVVPADYYDVGDFHEGLASVNFGNGDDGKFGFIDMTGKMAVNPRFDRVRDFVGGFATVSRNSLEGIVDKKGNLVLELQEAMPRPTGGQGKAKFSSVVEVSNSTSLKLVRLLGESGQVIFESAGRYRPGWGQLMHFNSGLAPYCDGDGLVGFVDQNGLVGIPPQFESAEKFVDDFSTAWVGDKCGIIDKTGHFVIPPNFKDLERPLDGLVSFEKDSDGGVKSYGLVNTTGEVVLGTGTVWPRWDGHYYSYSSAADGKVGLGDRTGKVVLKDSLYDSLEPVSQDVYRFTVGDLFGYVEVPSGKEIWRQSAQ